MNLEDQLARAAAMIAGTPGAGGSDITIHWRSATNLPWEHDPNDEDFTPPEMEDSQETVRGFHHVPGTGGHSSAYHRLAEFEAGDLILDIPTSFTFDDKKDVRFQVQGAYYTQKEAGRKINEIWAAASTANGGLQTLLVSRAQ
ncbi:MAG: hypothetical protein ACJAVK_001251 [Akkermansiaceae bacterium]|jgi:hypothetical protein